MVDGTGAFTSIPPPSRSIGAQFRRRAFWVTVAVYVLLTFGTHYFVISPWFRTLAEQHQGDLLLGFFSQYSGYGVVDLVVNELGWYIFLFQQALAVLVGLLLWRKYQAVALGILIVVFAFAVFLLCYMFVWLAATFRHGGIE